MLIGKSTRCDYRIENQYISREHCRITLRPDGLFIEDLGSMNGTFINGNRIPASTSVRINRGDSISLSGKIQLDWQVIDRIASQETARVNAPGGAPYHPPTPQPQMPPASQPVGYGYGSRYAGFWKRFGAILLDGILLWIVGMVIGFVIGAILGSAGADMITIQAFSIIVGTLAGWLYFAYFESSERQATLGKQALGIKVTDLYGNRVTFGKASGRHFGKIISALILYIGFIMAGFTEKKQALHDMMAGKLVVNK